MRFLFPILIALSFTDLGFASSHEMEASQDSLDPTKFYNLLEDLALNGPDMLFSQNSRDFPFYVEKDCREGLSEDDVRYSAFIDEADSFPRKKAADLIAHFANQFYPRKNGNLRVRRNLTYLYNFYIRLAAQE